MALSNIPAAGFAAENEYRTKKRLEKIEARLDALERRFGALDGDGAVEPLPQEEDQLPAEPSNGIQSQESDKDGLVAKAVSLGIGAPSILKRWGIDRLMAEIEKSERGES